MVGCEKSRYQRCPEDSKRLLDRTSKDETGDRVCGRGSQSGGSFDCVRSEAACLEEMSRLIPDVAMMGCERRRGCGSVCVHKSFAGGIDIEDHAVLVLVELGPSDHTEGRPIGEAPEAVEGDLAFWTVVGSEFDCLHSVLCSLEAAWVRSQHNQTRHGYSCCNKAWPHRISSCDSGTCDIRFWCDC
jgi:hypothetical protein